MFIRPERVAALEASSTDPDIEEDWRMVDFRGVATFYLLSLAFSWGWWGSLLVRGVDAPVEWSSSHLPGLLGPALAALVVSWIRSGSSGAMRLLRSLFQPWELPWLVLAAILAAPALALVILIVLGHPLVSGAVWDYPGVPPGTGPFLGLLAALILNAVGEEMGWRGYLLPQLLPLSRIKATLLLALLWAFWHLPMFFMPFSLGAQVSGGVIAGWFLGLTGGSFVLSWLWLVSGRALGSVVLWHLLFNYAVSTTATSGMIAAVVSTAVMVWGFAIALVWLRAR
jgi:membrane protease YdiL (CAAX protease family)